MHVIMASAHEVPPVPRIAMDSHPELQAIVFGGVVALILIYNLWKRKMKCCSENNKGPRPPEPAGAWPVIGHLPLLGGQDPVVRTLGAMADIYGPAFVIRLGKHRALVVSSWEMVKDCFTTNDRALASRPLGAAAKYMGYNGVMFGFNPYGSYWRETRKIATLELLSNTRLEILKHLRIREVDDFIKSLYSLCAVPAAGGAAWVKVEMKQRIEMIAFNALTMMIAGKRYFGTTDPSDVEEARRFTKAIEKFLYLFGVFLVSDALPYLKWLDLGGHIKAMKQTAKEMDIFLGSWVDQHRRNRLSCEADGKKDFIEIMLSIMPEDAQLPYGSDTIIKSTILNLLVAGSDTTTIALTWALSLLLNNPNVLKRAQHELDIHVGKDRQVDESDVRNLVYLQAIVKEAMRLYPPTPLSIPREATQDCNIGGYHVPKGTQLLVNIWKLHRDPRVWSDPLEFQPERFLSSQSNVDVRGQQHEYIPFSSGRRSCPGISFAMQILHLALARLLQGFNLKTPSDEPVDMTESLGITMAKATPLDVLLSPRLPSMLY